MADQMDKRLKALKASMKEALGKLTGSVELEAQGVRERAGRVAPEAAGPARKATAKKAPTKRRAKSPTRQRS